QIGVVGERLVQQGVRRPDALEVVVAVRHREQVLELLQQRLRLELRLDGDLLRQRDQQSAAIDQAGEDLAVGPILHWPSLSCRFQSRMRACAPAASASGTMLAAW